jgi:hypothetical protein
MGADASRACAPARRRDRGSKGKRGRAEGDHPACTSGFQSDNGPQRLPRGRSGRPPRPVPDLPGLHACLREGGALSSRTKQRPLGRSEAKVSRQLRDRTKKAPAGGSAELPPLGGTRDRVPPASDTLLTRRIDAIGRDASSGAVHESLVRQCGRAHESNLHISHDFLTPPRGLPCRPRAQQSAAPRPAVAAATPSLHPKARASRRHALLRS